MRLPGGEVGFQDLDLGGDRPELMLKGHCQTPRHRGNCALRSEYLRGALFFGIARNFQIPSASLVLRSAAAVLRPLQSKSLDAA
eukprot:scaffold2409_cov121-Isochrysis_galbana.AAC.7